MDFSVVNRMNLNQTVERILHVPGNYSGGQLEMTIVIDMYLTIDTIRDVLMNVSKSLKTHSEVFKNVRLNVVRWNSDTEMKNEVLPLMKLTMSSFYDELEQTMIMPIEEIEASFVKEKTVDSGYRKKIWLLTDYLKKFHARSKIVLVLTGADYAIPQEEEEKKALSLSLEPFLGKKLAFLKVKEDKLEVLYRVPAMWE